jgi:uncharacterized protein involved in exopolysaccharide biosynthesis
LTGTNPSYIPGTLKAFAAEYQDEIVATRKSRGTAAVSYYQAQLDSAKQSLDTANAAVVAYQHQHSGALPTTDAALNQLTQAAYQAQINYTTVQNSYQQAALSYQQAQAVSSFHVVDQPVSPYRLSSKKRLIFTVVAGFAAGLIISILAICALTALDRTARREEDIAGVLGMEVVATIRQLPRRRMLPGLRKAKSS